MSNCETCKWFKPIWEEVARERWSHLGNGECHRFPPNHDHLFAKTAKSDWCGEHAEKDDS